MATRSFFRLHPRRVESKLPVVTGKLVRSRVPHQHLQLFRLAGTRSYASVSSSEDSEPPIRYQKVPKRSWPQTQLNDDLRDSEDAGKPLIRYQNRGEPGLRRTSPSEELSIETVRRMVSQGHLFHPTSRQPLVVARELRNACKCENCVNPSDRQRNYHFAEIPVDIEVEGYEVDAEGTYSVRWKNDVPGFENHISRYTKPDVTEAAIFVKKHGQSVFTRPLFLWRSQDLDMKASTLPYDSLIDTSGGLAQVLHRLSAFGLVFITDVPKDETSVRKIAERVGTLRNTFYGPTWDVRSVPDAKNVAYTSRNLGFHMDLLYMREPPGFQLLHCLENTCEGGHSRFVDTFKALDILITKQGPSALRRLMNETIPYEYSNDGAYYYDTKPVVSMESWPRVRRSFKNTENLQLLSSLSRIYWSPPFVAPHMSAYRRGREENMQTAKAFADTLEAPDLVLTTKLSPGTCVIFDNLRVAHARTAFDTSAGHRWLKGAYVDHQDFYSKMVALEQELPQRL